MHSLLCISIFAFLRVAVASGMVHKYGEKALEKRRDRAIARGFLKPGRHVQLPRNVTRQAAQCVLGSMDLHAEHVKLAAKDEHFAWQATEAAVHKGMLSRSEANRAHQLHRKAGKAKHEVGRRMLDDSSWPALALSPPPKRSDSQARKWADVEDDDFSVPPPPCSASSSAVLLTPPQSSVDPLAFSPPPCSGLSEQLEVKMEQQFLVTRDDLSFGAQSFYPVADREHGKNMSANSELCQRIDLIEDELCTDREPPHAALATSYPSLSSFSYLAANSSVNLPPERSENPAGSGAAQVQFNGGVGYLVSQCGDWHSFEALQAQLAEAETALQIWMRQCELLQDQNTALQLQLFSHAHSGGAHEMANLVPAVDSDVSFRIGVLERRLDKVATSNNRIEVIEDSITQLRSAITLLEGTLSDSDANFVTELQDSLQKHISQVVQQVQEVSDDSLQKAARHFAGQVSALQPRDDGELVTQSDYRSALRSMAEDFQLLSDNVSTGVDVKTFTQLSDAFAVLKEEVQLLRTSAAADARNGSESLEKGKGISGNLSSARGKFRDGDIVEIHSLKSTVLNGEIGVIQSFDSASGRYAVLLTTVDGATAGKLFKAENMRSLEVDDDDYGSEARLEQYMDAAQNNGYSSAEFSRSSTVFY